MTSPGKRADSPPLPDTGRQRGGLAPRSAVVIHDFSCRRCGECCRIPGQIHLTEPDITRLAAFLGLTEHDFIQRHADLARHRRGLVIQGNPALPCRFLQGNSCLVYPARPQQCADYPVRWNNPGWERICKPAADGTTPA